MLPWAASRKRRGNLYLAFVQILPAVLTQLLNPLGCATVESRPEVVMGRLEGKRSDRVGSKERRAARKAGKRGLAH